MAVASTHVRDVILRDGGTLRLRAPDRGDLDELVGFFGRLSELSLYRRFHGFPALRLATVEPFVDPDWQDRGSLIGTVSSDEGCERIVAVANYVRLLDPSCAEVAFAVADELQGHGVGTRLLEQLADSALEVGISIFVAEVMSDNTPMLHMFEDAGFDVARRLEGGTVEVRLSIALPRAKAW
jgi:GNAT superfamily N-acetyltransferase